MTKRECKIFDTLARYLKDRKIIYRRAAHIATEKGFEDAQLWSDEVSVRNINESRGVLATRLHARPTAIGRMWLFIMDIVIEIRSLIGLKDRNSILDFCLAMDSIVIWRYQKVAEMSHEAKVMFTRQLDALKNARERMHEIRTYRHKVHPFAPHFKLI